LGFIKEKTLIDFIARQQHLPVVNLAEVVIPDRLARKIPRSLIEKHQVLPISFSGGVLTIVTSDPFDFDALEEIQLAVGYKVEINLAPQSAIKKAIQELSKQQEVQLLSEKTKEELMQEIAQEAEKTAPPLESDQPTRLQLSRALIPLLIEKGIITEAELIQKARQLYQKQSVS
jgi:type II secretory ATPase GspE/PulE/Tfp pilus assembly ATPase PilB-like protein